MRPMPNEMNYHTTVLLHEGVDALDVKTDGTYVDVTLGAGGHSREILKRLGPKGRLFGFDQDADALGQQREDDRFTLCFGNFRFMQQFFQVGNIFVQKLNIFLKQSIRQVSIDNDIFNFSLLNNQVLSDITFISLGGLQACKKTAIKDHRIQIKPGSEVVF